MISMQDRLLKTICWYVACLLPIIFFGIFVTLWGNSYPAFFTFGSHFIWSSDWDPVTQHFGAWTAIVGTLLTSIIAIVLACPIGFAVSACVTHILPHHWTICIRMGLQILAGIPSIIYGMWGLFVLVPIFSSYIEPYLIDGFKHLPFVSSLFSGTPFGIGILTAACVLAIMIVPLVTSMMISLFEKVPLILKESGHASGATRWEVIYRIELPYLRSGIIGSVLLGLGRALGETMAVTFVIGNTHQPIHSLLMPASTIASTIANELTEATAPLYHASIMALAFILMSITASAVVISRILLNQYRQ